MDSFTERLGMTKSGLWIIVVLVVAIFAAGFMLPNNKPKQVRFKKYDAETIQAAQMAASSGRSPAAASPDAAPVPAAAAPAAPTAAGMVAAPVSTLSKATLDDLRARVGRENPFEPVENFESKKADDKDKDTKTVAAAAAAPVKSDPALGTPFGPLPSYNFIEELPEVESKPQKPADVMDYFQPSFLLSVISRGPDGTCFVIINGEILRVGRKVPGTGYTVYSIDEIGLNEVVLQNDKKQEIVLKLKQSGSDFFIRPSADGRHLTITNQDEERDRGAKPAKKTDKESDNKGGTPPWTLPPLN